MARFSQERYDELKALFDANKIDKKTRAQFEVASHLRWLRHAQKIICTDEQIIQAVNQEVDWRMFEKGPNWKDTDAR